MKNPLQMYSKIGDLKIIQIKKEKNNTKSRITYNQILPPNLPLLVKKIPLHPFIGSLNKKLTTGIIISSKINQLRKDGMSFKYFRYNYLLSQDIGKLSKQPLDRKSVV